MLKLYQCSFKRSSITARIANLSLIKSENRLAVWVILEISSS